MCGVGQSSLSSSILSLAAVFLLGGAPAVPAAASASQGPPASLAALTVSAKDVVVGERVVYTASTTAASGGVEFRFDVYDAVHASWTLIQPYGASNSVSWTPVAPGTYWVQVWVRNVGSASAWEDWRNSAVITVSPAATPPARLTSYTASRSTTTVASPVTFTAAATGGSGSYEYQFDVYDVGHGTWTALQAYGPTGTATWTPMAPGTYWVQVWVRNVGSASPWEDWRNSAVITVSPAATPPARLASYTASQSTTTVATAVTFTATATGGSGSYEYRFDVYDVGHGTWTALQAYGPTRTATWTPVAPGTYWVQVWVRNVGSASPWEDWRNSAVITVLPAATPPARLASYTASQSITTVASPVTFTAVATGGSGSYEYQFDLYDVGLGTWTALQAYGPAGTATWTPMAPGTYWVQVWVRNVGSASAWEDWRNSAVVTVSPAATPPARLASYTASQSTTTVASPVAFTAAATGGSGSYEYQFDVYDVGLGTWTALQAYGPTDTATWTPTAPGTYWVQVWVRNVGSASAWEDWRNSAVITVAPAAPPPARLASYTASRSTTTVASPVTFTAAATGGSGSYEYQFDVYDVGHGTWTALQAYGPTGVARWTPDEAGTYWVQVWVRNVGSASAWEDWRNSAVVTVTEPEAWSVVRTVAGSHVVSWNAVPGATAYLVLESADRTSLAGSPSLDGAARVSGTTYTTPRAADATDRYFRVFPVTGEVVGAGGPIAATTRVTPHAVPTPFPPVSGPAGEALSFDATPALWDIDGDGCLDMVGRIGHCDGTFTSGPLDPAGIGLLTANGRANRDSRFADLTGDGLVDILTNVYAPADDASSRVVLLVGQPDGTFRPDAGVAALGIGGFGETVVMADFDNDGDIDVYLPHYFDRNDGAHSWLLVNDGHGAFEDVAAAAGLDSTAPLNPEGAQALDVDQDGWVDLVVAGHLYINNHDLTFTDRAAEFGLPVVFDEGLLLLDVDLDGDLDLVHHDGQVTRLYRNNGERLDGSIALLGADGQTQGYGLNACDVNGDGYQDLVVAQNHATNGTGVPRLLLNGGGHFSVSDLDSLTATYVDLIACADLDGSGRPDLLVRSRVGNDSLYQSLVTRGGSQETLTLRVLGAHGERNQQGRAVRVRRASGSGQTLLRFVESGSAYMAQNGYDLLVGVPWAEPLEVSVLFQNGWVTTTAQPGDALTIHEDGRVVAGLH